MLGGERISVIRFDTVERVTNRQTNRHRSTPSVVHASQYKYTQRFDVDKPVSNVIPLSHSTKSRPNE